MTRIVIVNAIGLPEKDCRMIRNILSLAGSKDQSYRLAVNSVEQADIVIINADDSMAMVCWNEYRQMVPDANVVLASATPLVESDYVSIKRPLIASQLHGILALGGQPKTQAPQQHKYEALKKSFLFRSLSPIPVSYTHLDVYKRQHYFKTSDPAHVARHLSWHIGQLGIDPSEGPELTEVVKAFRERAKTLKEMAENSAFLYCEFEAYEEKAASKNLTVAAEAPLQQLHEALAAVSEWQGESIHAAVSRVAEQSGLALGKVAQPLRVAVSGTAVSPTIDTTLELLGRCKTLARIKRALDYIKQRDSESLDLK